MPTPSSSNDEQLLDAATQIRIRDIITNKAKQLAPSHIAPYIIGDKNSIEKTSGGYTIKIVARVKDYHKFPGIADARAQEYGSGERSTGKKIESPGQKKLGSGSRGKYLIEPKKAGGVLAFPWDKADSIPELQKHKSKDGRYIFSKVKHPGIYPYQGRGYMRVALQESVPQIIDLVGPEAANALGLKISTIFSRPGGKKK